MKIQIPLKCTIDGRKTAAAATATSNIALSGKPEEMIDYRSFKHREVAISAELHLNVLIIRHMD